MEELSKGNVRRMLQDYLYGEIEEYLQDHIGVRCPKNWRTEVRSIARRCLEILFRSDYSEITDVYQDDYDLKFTYVLRGYGYGDAANVEFERSSNMYLSIRFTVLKDGHVTSAVKYVYEYDEATMYYQSLDGNVYSVMG